jgi:hypothetical protein
MRIGAVLAAGLVGIAVALGIVLLDSERRQAGTNYVPEVAEAVTIEGAGSHCQNGQLVPADAAALRLLVGSFGRPTPELEVAIHARGQAIETARLPAGGSEGHVLIPVGPFDERHENARVCIRVLGQSRGRRTVLYGTVDRVRLEWLREGRESWLDIVPAVAHRFGLGKPFMSGPGLLLLTVALLALAWVVALRLIAREMGR